MTLLDINTNTIVDLTMRAGSVSIFGNAVSVLRLCPAVLVQQLAATALSNSSMTLQ